MDKIECRKLDGLLREFNSSHNGIITYEVLLNKEKPFKDWHSVLDFLVEEGYLKKYDTYLQITYKGRVFIHNGGFFRKYIRERVLVYCTVIAAVCSFVGLLVSLIALVR